MWGRASCVSSPLTNVLPPDPSTYAESPAQGFVTMDYDMFVEPTLSNVEQAVQCLTHLGFMVGPAAG